MGRSSKRKILKKQKEPEREHVKKELPPPLFKDRAKPEDIVQQTSKLVNPNENRHIPSTAEYKTILRNVMTTDVSDAVLDAVVEGRKEMITCHCKGDCSKNKRCPCHNTAMWFKESFGSALDKHGLKIDTDSEVWKNADVLMFTCGQGCGCGEKCKLNIFKDINKDHRKKFEVVRLCKKMGFCVYAKQKIRKGEPVIEFVGEVAGWRTAREPKHIRYSFAIFSGKWEKMKEMLSAENAGGKILKKYRDLLQKAYNTKLWVCPLEQGNCSRYLSHSCKPNLFPMRVFEGGLSPENCRFVFVAEKDIEVGEELTIHYGSDYVDAYFKDQCLCASCKETREKKKKVASSRASSHAVKRKQPNGPVAPKRARLTANRIHRRGNRDNSSNSSAKPKTGANRPRKTRSSPRQASSNAAVSVVNAPPLKNTAGSGIPIGGQQLGVSARTARIMKRNAAAAAVASVPARPAPSSEEMRQTRSMTARIRGI